MAKLNVYKFTHVGDGLYDLRDGYNELGTVRLAPRSPVQLSAVEAVIYSWSQTGWIDAEGGNMLKVPFPDGSLARIDQPNLVIYMYQAWPTVVGGRDMGKVKELHFFAKH